MDPVALIATALAAGVGLAAGDEASEDVRAAYSRLREAVLQQFVGAPGGKLALGRHEANPQVGTAVLESELARAGAGDNAAVVSAALAVMMLADHAVARAGKYSVGVSGSQAVQVGDNNVQFNSYFTLERGDGTAGSVVESPPGRPLAEVTDPFALEVHRPVQPDAPRPRLPVLPDYLSREFDQELATVVQTAARGESGIVVLVGGSSTGKTRACWEALRLLRDRPEGWRLWHPIDPSHPVAALRELPIIAPYTVVWLNEAQFYLGVAADGLGERVAAGLRELLRDPGRGPVLVLAALWPQFWSELSVRPAGAEDPHRQARELLSGRDIRVPASLSTAERDLLRASGDPRLVAAAEAEDGQATQFLAGVPELLARYRNAPLAARALIDAAIDARRLGMGQALPLPFLRVAAPGYFSDTEWENADDAGDWLEQGLVYAGQPCKGTRGPLTRVRPRLTGDGALNAQAGHRLADYLEQHGRRAFRSRIPPGTFWSAAADFARPEDLDVLAGAAEGRGLLRDAARLRKRAAGHGDAAQAAELIRTWRSIYPYSTDPGPVNWAASHASVNDPGGVARLLDELRAAGAERQVAELLARDPAAHVLLARPNEVVALLDALRAAGAEEQAAELTRRVVGQASLGDPGKVATLLTHLRDTGAKQYVADLLARDPAAQVAITSAGDIDHLMRALRKAGAREQAAALARRAAGHAPLDDPGRLARLLEALRLAGAKDEIDVLLARDPASHVVLTDLDAVAWLADSLTRSARATEQRDALLLRASAHASLRNADDVDVLLRALKKADAAEQAAALTVRAANEIPLSSPWVVARTLNVLQEAGAPKQVAALLSRDPALQVSLDSPGTVAHLLETLLKMGAREQTAALLARNPAAQVSLGSAGGVAWLLEALLRAGAELQRAVLISREPAAQVSLHSSEEVAWLLDALRRTDAQDLPVLASRTADEAPFDDLRFLGSEGSWIVSGIVRLLIGSGMQEEASRLVRRLPAEGLFSLFLDQAEDSTQYRYGLEADGTPSAPWGWGDLELPGPYRALAARNHRSVGDGRGSVGACMPCTGVSEAGPFAGNAAQSPSRMVVMYRNASIRSMWTISVASFMDLTFLS